MLGRPTPPNSPQARRPPARPWTAAIALLAALPALTLRPVSPVPVHPLSAQESGSPPSADGQQEVALRAIEAAALRYRQAQASCADFEQVVDVRLLDRRVESAGRVCQQRPNFFSMRFTRPDGDLVVSDGEHFWVYYRSLDPDQVVRYPVAQSPGGYDFYREFLDDPGRKYVLRDGGVDEVDGHECRIVELAPKGEAAYRQARVWLDDNTNLIRRLEVRHENGTLRTLSLRNVDLAPALDPDYFDFRVPEGARVMDGPSRPGA